MHYSAGRLHEEKPEVTQPHVLVHSRSDFPTKIGRRSAITIRIADIGRPTEHSTTADRTIAQRSGQRSE